MGKQTKRRGLRFAIPAAVAVLAITMFASVAVADATWEGIDWTGPATLDGANLVVENDGSGLPAAHYNTPDPFRASPVQAITFSFIDSGPGTVGAGIYVEDEDAAALTTFGVVPGFDEYQVFRLGNGLNQQDTTGVTRTAGEHTFQIALLADGSIDYVIDGVLVFSSPWFGMDKFGDVYLRARGGAEGDTVTYTSYLAETEYERPDPPANLNFAFFFGDCESDNETRQSLFGGFGCRGFGLFFGDFDEASLAAAIRAEAYEQLGEFNTVVVRAHGFQVGSPFVDSIHISEEPACFVSLPQTADSASQIGGLGGLWIVWFTIEICPTSTPV